MSVGRLPSSGTWFPGSINGEDVSKPISAAFCFTCQHHAISRSSFLLFLWLLLPLLLGGVTRTYIWRSWLPQGTATAELPALAKGLSQTSPHCTSWERPASTKSPENYFLWQLLKVSDFLTGFFSPSVFINFTF